MPGTHAQLSIEPISICPTPLPPACVASAHSQHSGTHALLPPGPSTGLARSDFLGKWDYKTGTTCLMAGDAGCPDALVLSALVHKQRGMLVACPRQMALHAVELLSDGDFRHGCHGHFTVNGSAHAGTHKQRFGCNNGTAVATSAALIGALRQPLLGDAYEGLPASIAMELKNHKEAEQRKRLRRPGLENRRPSGGHRRHKAARLVGMEALGGKNEASPETYATAVQRQEQQRAVVFAVAVPARIEAAPD